MTDQLTDTDSVIDLQWCADQNHRILERDSQCQSCGRLTTVYGRSKPWATRCELCGEDRMRPFGGLILERDKAEPFMLGEALS